LQHAIVDQRFRETDYRTRQNYVGESVSFGQERVHYVCPKPEQVDDASLEAFSRPLLDLVEYRLDDEGQMTVMRDSSAWYQ